jgi:putative transposase
MAFRLIESAHTRWRAVNAPYLAALVHAGAVCKNGSFIERPTDQRVVFSTSRDMPILRS